MYDCILWCRRDREECCAIGVGPKITFIINIKSMLYCLDFLVVFIF